MCVPDVASQSRTVQSRDPDKIRTEHTGEKHTQLTRALCPCKTETSIPNLISHRRMVESSDPDTTCAPSGEHATERTGPEWPRIRSTASAPDAASHIPMVPSPKPATIRAPFGVTATECTASAWSEITMSGGDQHFLRFPAIRGIPSMPWNLVYISVPAGVKGNALS